MGNMGEFQWPLENPLTTVRPILVKTNLSKAEVRHKST